MPGYEVSTEARWLAIVVLMVVATVAALSVSYAPKRAFGTAWDYAALAVGVFGSTSVAGIVAAALLWRRTQPQS
jgi:Na+/glutamate symporter